MMSFCTEQESIYKNTAVVGCGAAGGLASVLLVKNPYNNVTAFDTREPFSTLLPTGGGRCNITNAKGDVNEFVKNYPRGEKFLISVFSRFNQEQTRQLFTSLGVKTYVQEDYRVFPVSDSALKTVQTLKKHLETSNFSLKKEKVIDIRKSNKEFFIKTNLSEYQFDSVILATGGKGGFELASKLGHNIIECRPSLFSLDILEKEFYSLAGLSFKNVQITVVKSNKKNNCASGDLMFSHKSITGPAVFKISSLNAYTDFNIENPLELTLKLSDITKEEIDKIISENLKKTVKNVFSLIVPSRFISLILQKNNIDGSKQTAQMKKSEKEFLINSITNLKLHAVSKIKDSEIVTAGGIDLKEIDNRTMQSKIVKGLYCIGEILDIDGFTGGYNLQNCWSGAYICSLNI